MLIVEDIAANHGKQALELVEADPDAFSMILMDLQMPMMDGITATQLMRLNEISTNRHIIIVALTANETVGIQEQGLEADMDDFIHKPVMLTKLDHILTKWLNDA